MNKPKIIIEVEGGNVCAVFADCDVDVSVLDYDNYYVCEESEAETYEDIMIEAGMLKKVW